MCAQTLELLDEIIHLTSARFGASGAIQTIAEVAGMEILALPILEYHQERAANHEIQPRSLESEDIETVALKMEELCDLRRKSVCGRSGCRVSRD